ncbi:TonB-dependent receptor [Pseudomonas aeruginosa]
MGARLRRPLLQRLRQQLWLAGRGRRAPEDAAGPLRLRLRDPRPRRPVHLAEAGRRLYQVRAQGNRGWRDRHHLQERRLRRPHRGPPPPARPAERGGRRAVRQQPLLRPRREAFVPHTETDSAALFALEEWKLSDRLDLSFGARLEHTRVDPDAKGNERFAENDGSQSFTTGSLSTGAVYKLTPIWSLAATLSYTERAPTFYELYANGPHAATGTYEVGDADADKEKAVSTDLALRFDNGVHKGSVGVFYSRFSNYIGLLASGRHRNEEGEVVAAGDDEALPEYLYSGVRADFYGVEAQDRIHLLESPYGNFDLELSGDYTRAKNKDTGEPLPRIAPLRLNTALIWELQQWQARVDVEHAASQHRVPEEELSTDGYTTLGASLGYNFDLGESRWLAFVKGTNLTNQTVRYASSILRDRVPAAGRGIEAGVKVAF